VLDEVPSYNSGPNYNPQKVIRAVNLLQPLGKTKAIAVLQEYLRIVPRNQKVGREGTFLVMRVLFNVPKEAGYLPEMGVGGDTPKKIRD